MASSSAIGAHLKKFTLRQSKKVVPFCSANQDPISIRRSELIQELCRTHEAFQNKKKGYDATAIGEFQQNFMIINGALLYIKETPLEIFVAIY